MRVRRHLPTAGRWLAWTGTLRQRLSSLRRGKRLALWAGLALVPFGVGYVFAAVVLFPAPIFASTKVVPRLIGLGTEAARQALEQAELRSGAIESSSHPTAARGEVVWQDPPAGVQVPGRTPVALSVSRGPQRIPVPDLAGYDMEIARRLVSASGLRVRRVDSTQAPVPKDVVVNTRPPAGATLLPSSGVTLVVSVGAPTITVPDLSGLAREEAEMALEQAGLALGTWMWRTSRAQPPGTIIDQDPAPGTLSAPGTVINVTLARLRSP